MPCRWSRRSRCQRACADGGALAQSDTEPRMDSWMKVRFRFLRSMRRNVKWIVLILSFAEIIKYTPLAMAKAGQDGTYPGGDEAYGIAYNVGRFLSWIYVCLFSLFWVPLFSWWVPEEIPDGPAITILTKFADIMTKLNMGLIPIVVLFSLVQYAFHLAMVLYYVEGTPAGQLVKPANNRRNWYTRLGLVCSVISSLCFGNAAFRIWESAGLARVKPIEYWLIVIPAQINLGIVAGSIMQRRVEKRAARKLAEKLEGAKTERDAEAGTVDEKAALIDV